MPRLPRTSGSKVVSTLKNMGFVVARQRGSHVILRKGDRGCAVPLHKELKVGTLSGILRQGGVEPDEFMKFFKR